MPKWKELGGRLGFSVCFMVFFVFFFKFPKSWCIQEKETIFFVSLTFDVFLLGAGEAREIFQRGGNCAQD